MLAQAKMRPPSTQPRRSPWWVHIRQLLVIVVAVLLGSYTLASETQHFLRSRSNDMRHLEPCLILTEWTSELHFPERTLYDMVGVSPDATAHEIEEAYFMRAAHLTCDSSTAQHIAANVCQELRLLGRASMLLGNTTKRKAYDFEFRTRMEKGATELETVGAWQQRLERVCGFGARDI